MKKYSDLLLKSLLFEGIDHGDLGTMLNCLNVKVVHYDKENSIFLAGNKAKYVGFVTQGIVQVVRDDMFGNQTVLSKLAQGDLFGETFACAEVEILPVTVTAVTDCEVLLLDYQKIIKTCSNACVFHSRLIENMLKIMAHKNLMLNQKNAVLSARTIREKLMAYLISQTTSLQKTEIEIPFNRQELADYLSVDRSALSREMSIMQKEGLIKYDKNKFNVQNV